jgi:threonine synthase
VKYISTRGQAPKLGFEDVVLAGLAEDGGLYVPSYYPTLSAQDMHDFSTASFQDIALRALKPYLNNEISEQDFADLVDKAYSTFHHKAVTPLVQLGGGEWLLELYHGSTIAFKDVALQLLGQLFSYILNKRQQKVTIIGATAIRGRLRLRHLEGLKD